MVKEDTRKKKNTRHFWRERSPKTTKQTATLTKVAGQKAPEKSLNGTYRLQKRNTINKSSSWKSWCKQIIIMKILVYLTFRESPLRLYYHDNHRGYTTETITSWLQTNQNSTSDYDRQFSNQRDRCKMLKVVHGNQSDNHCIRSDTQPSIPLLYILYSITAVPENTPSSPSPV